MPTFACRDAGMDCDFATSGATTDEVKTKVMQHAKVKHADVVKTLSTPQKMAEFEKTIASKIKM